MSVRFQFQFQFQICLFCLGKFTRPSLLYELLQSFEVQFSCSETFDDRLLTGSSRLSCLGWTRQSTATPKFPVGYFLSALAVIMELCSNAGCRLLTNLLCSLRNVAVYLHLQLTYSSSLHQEFKRPSVHQDQQAGVQSSCQSASVPLTQDALQATRTCIVQFTNPLCGAMHWLLDHYLSRVSAATNGQ